MNSQLLNVGRKVLGDSTGKGLASFRTEELTRHGVILGSTGSGKTGLGLALMEELAIAGVPIIAIDPKGDLGNFCDVPLVRSSLPNSGWGRQFSAIAPRENKRESFYFSPWLQRLKAVDATIYTPKTGSNGDGAEGVPLSILGAQPDREEYLKWLLKMSYREKGDIDPIDPRYVYLDHVWSYRGDSGGKRPTARIGWGPIIDGVLRPPMNRIGSLTPDEFFSESQRKEMAVRLTALTESGLYKQWTRGRVCDVDKELLRNQLTGRPRVSIVSIAHLTDQERQWYLPLLLSEIVTTMRGWEGSQGLKAILYVDECYGMLPPVANPPTKGYLMTLLKQARGYGLGVVLGTQNPADLDYRALSNVGNWWVGRLGTDRDRDRVGEALRASEGGLDLGEALGGLNPREFIQSTYLNREPVKIRSRDVHCRLSGPMTLEQVGQAMKWRKRGGESLGGENESGSPDQSQLERGVRLMKVRAMRAASESMCDDLRFGLKCAIRAKPAVGKTRALPSLKEFSKFVRPILKIRGKSALYDVMLNYGSAVK